MTKVVLKDAAVVAALDAIENRSQLCDATGRVLGYFVPQTCDGPISYRGVKSPLSPEERERILREEAGKGKTLAEFWDEMRRKHPEKFQ
jgi:hypothetical protein